MSVQFQDGSGERSPNSEDVVREADLGDPGDTGSTGAPGSEGEAPRFDDGGSEPPGYESDPGRDDSSAGSALPNSGPTFGDLVDLTGPERCRVRMSLRGKTISAVCGQIRAECGRRGHRNKTNAGDSHCGVPGFYIRCEAGRSDPHGMADGHQDRQIFTRAEAFALRDGEATAMASHLRQGLRQEQPGSPSIPEVHYPEEGLTPGPTASPTGDPGRPGFMSPPGASPVDRTARNVGPDLDPPATPIRQTPGQPHHDAAPRGGGTSGSPIPVDEAPGGPSPTPPGAPATQSPPQFLLYGMEDPDGARILTESEEHRTRLTRKGWYHARTFHTPDYGDRWESRGRLIPPTPPGGDQTKSQGPDLMSFYGLIRPSGERTYARGEQDATAIGKHGYTVRHVFGTEEKAEAWVSGEPSNTGPPPAPPVLPTQAPEAYDRIAAQVRIGVDESTSSDEIFGVNYNRTQAMDALALPANTTGKDTRSMLYEAATDVLALPGIYQKDVDYDDATTDLVTALTSTLSGKRDSGLNANYRAKKNNGLSQIVIRDDLFRVVRQVQETGELAEKTQRSMYIKVLGDQGYSYDATLLYLQTGVLPRIIRDTYAMYLNMLTTMATWALTGAGGGWRDGLAYTMVKHHRDKLAMLRVQAADFRGLVFQNYTYMREANKKKFYVEGVSQQLWDRLAEPSYQPVSDDGGKCPTCKRAGLHPGILNCPLLALPATSRTRCLSGLKHRAAQKAVSRVKAAYDQDPSADPEEVLAKARDGL